MIKWILAKKNPKTYRTYILKGQERTMPERSPASRMLKWQAYLLTPPHFPFQGVHKYMYNKELHSLTHQQINIYAEYFFALIYWFLFSTWSHMSAAAIFMSLCTEYEQCVVVVVIWKFFFLFCFFYKIILIVKKKIT